MRIVKTHRVILKRKKERREHREGSHASVTFLPRKPRHSAETLRGPLKSPSLQSTPPRLTRGSLTRVLGKPSSYLLHRIILYPRTPHIILPRNIKLLIYKTRAAKSRSRSSSQLRLGKTRGCWGKESSLSLRKPKRLFRRHRALSYLRVTTQ